MFNMLEQAIIDAESLKEAARQSAEEKIVEHFSKDIKEAVDMILEQEDMMGLGDLGTMANTTPYDPAMAAMPTEMPTAAPSLVDVEAESNTKDNGKFVVDQLPYAATTDSKTFVSIDLDRLEESIRQDLEENSMEIEHLEEEYDLEEHILLDEAEEDGAEDDEDETTNESIERMIRSVLAEEMDDLLKEDDKEENPKPGTPDAIEKALGETPCDKSKRARKEYSAKGYTSTSEEASVKELEKKCAEHEKKSPSSKQNESIQRKNKTLIKEQKTLNKKVHLLEEKLEKYGTVINKLQEKLNETNLANAKLLYQNRVLDSDSLNERQKDRIVETIMNATTVEEAKIIYETLQSAVGANSLKRKPKSLNEVVTKRSSAFMPRKEEKRVDPFTARMKALAGIKD